VCLSGGVVPLGPYRYATVDEALAWHYASHGEDIPAGLSWALVPVGRLEAVAREAVASDLDAARDEAVRAERGTAADREAWGDPRTVARRAAVRGHAWADDVDLRSLSVPLAIGADLRAAHLAADDDETERLALEALAAAIGSAAWRLPPFAATAEPNLAALCVPLALVLAGEVRDAYIDALEAAAADEGETEAAVFSALERVGREIAEGWLAQTSAADREARLRYDLSEHGDREAVERAVREAGAGLWPCVGAAEYDSAAQAYREAVREALART
jgi:hypothetical protein